ncbi:MAG: sulfatase-like hydrolase/transferase, partial [Halobacteriales archaeon]|nr:sulfatase-like hydrolase/transferase [Halobacteriales archaeon]
MISGGLHSLSDRSVDNVLIYVSDSHRYDYLPDTVREMGVSGRAIAASTFTGSGYPSIMTGTYPSTHRVWNFRDSLADRPRLLRQCGQSGIDATHVWRNVEPPAKKPPLRICGEPSETTLSDLESPFVLVVHDRGGHLLYGRSSESERWASLQDFFQDLAGRPDEIDRLYRDGIAESVEHFQELVDTLKTQSKFKNTLVVFTSDHGELLGEYGGLYGHGAPLVPELLDVPLVFTGAGLPRNE